MSRDTSEANSRLIRMLFMRSVNRPMMSFPKTEPFKRAGRKTLKN